MFHNPISEREVRSFLGKAKGSVTFASLSEDQSRHVRHLGRWVTIPGGLSLSTFHASLTPVSPPYLAFLGRLTRVKGAHTAIAVSKATGIPLKIAGNIVDDEEGKLYFRQEIEPHLCPGKTDYLGEVDDFAKDGLLGGATAVLFPITWDEPFGRVVVEAMACGTPPIAFARGAVTETITDGVDGILCNSVEEMIAAVKRVSTIDRKACRRTAERSYSDEALVTKYEDLFYRILDKQRNGYSQATSGFEQNPL
jgi:glycosyltransferase involved in cell wall biosynthesis